MRKKLVLSKEVLSELATDELRSVVGGGTHTYCETDFTYCKVCPAISDLSEVSSVNAPCQTR